MTEYSYIIRSESIGFPETEKHLDNVANKGARAERATDGLAKSSKRVASSFSGMGPRAAQVSYQLQDMAVQAQSGTSAFIILGQQGSQLASAFGPAGAVFGGVIAIASAVGGTLAASFYSAADAADEMEQRISEAVGKTLRESLRAKNEEVEAQEATVKRIRGEIEKVNNLAPARSTNIYASSEERAAEIARIEEARTKNRKEQLFQLAVAEEKLNTLKEKQLKLEGELSGATEKKKAKEKATSALTEAVEQIRKDGLTRLEAEKEVHDERMGLIDKYEKMGLGTEAEYNSLRKAEKIRHDNEILSIDKAGHDAKIKQKLEQQRATEALEKQVEQYRVTALSPEAREKEEHDRRMAAIQKYEEAEMANEVRYWHLRELERERHKQAMVNITEEEEEQKNTLLNTAQETALGATGQLMGNMASLFAEGGKDTFDEYKAFASAQAAISAALAINNALAVPPPVGEALAVSIGALTAFQLAKIQSMEYQGRAKGGQVLGGQTYLVGERGPELLTMGGNGSITPNHQMKNGSSSNISVTNVFQISAGVSGTVRAEIARVAPSIAKLAQQGVEQAIRNGGSMARAVGAR